MTTAADLLASIETADAAECVRLLDGLDERARRELHTAVARQIEDLDKLLEDYSSPSRRRTYELYAVARVALLGTATLGELKKSSMWTLLNTQEAAARVLADRHPDWLANWVEFELARNVGNWGIVRALVRGGAMPRPSTELYVLGMIAAPARSIPPRELLQQDPALFHEELWRLFEHEGSGELSLAAYDKYVQPSHSWSNAFREMVADGTIGRGRVLGATLDALQRDFAPFRAGWFSRLHEALKPTKAERAELCERYLDLLSSRFPATVSFAMKALTEVHKSGALNVVAAASRLAPAFEARDKGTVERALALASKAARGSDADTKAKLASLAARALGHESPDVQNAALELVGGDATLLEPYLAVLAPSVRASLGAGSLIAGPDTHARVAESQNAVVPVGSLVELVERFSAVLESQGPPIQIESVIDGVARIGIPAAGSREFERVTAALAKRAEALRSRPARPGSPEPRAALAMLAVAWTRGVRIAPPTKEESLADFLTWRLWCVSEQAAQRIEQPLLSLPTTPDGRIEPGEFERRLGSLTARQRRAAETDRESLFHLDFLLARLRANGWDRTANMRVDWKKRSWVVQGQTYSHCEPLLKTEGLPEPSRFDPAGLTTAKFGASLEMKRWCATVSPHWCEGWFAAGCRDLGYNIDWHSADWSTRAYLEPLVNHHTPIGPMGALLLALGLGARETGESGLATDALIAATSDSRLGAVELGNALVEAASSGAIKFGRWAKRLQQASQAGAQQASTIFLAIEALMESGRHVDSGDFGRLVELELELAHQTGLRIIRSGARNRIRALSGSSKTGRAAAALLKLPE